MKKSLCGETVKAESRDVVVTEAVSYLRLTDSCITQLKAQGPARTCNESQKNAEASAPGFEIRDSGFGVRVSGFGIQDSD